MCSHKNIKRDFVFSFSQVALPTLCQVPVLERRPSPALQFSCDFYYFECQRKLHAHLLKSLVKVWGIFVSSYSCSVWEAGPFSLSLTFLSSHRLHCYSSWTFSGHSQAGSASPVTQISVTCPEIKLSQGLWKGQTALGGWVNPLHWTFPLVTGVMCT